MDSRLAIRLLGEFHISYNGQPVEGFGTARLQSLLAYLILHHDVPQPRRHLAFLLWPDSSESSARNNLRQLIYQLRQVLPDADRFLINAAATIGWKLDGDQAIDVVLLEGALEQAATAGSQQNQDVQLYALEQAAQTMRGMLLPGCYDEWIAPERERLQALSASALQKLVQFYEQRRDYAAAIQAAGTLLRLDPLDESLHTLLIRLHKLNHDPAGAIRVYQAACQTLERELGIHPGPQLQQAYEQIQQAEADESERKKLAGSASFQGLIGRQAEWQRLRVAWQRAASGSAGMVMITGEAGIGKSRLAEEMVHWANQQEILTARAHAYGVEGQLTLAPVAEWLRDAHFQPFTGALEPGWKSELSRLLSELRIHAPDLPRPEPIHEYGQRQHFFEALARLVLLPGRPTLLVMDDMQWCDQETLEWLHFLLRFDPHAPLLILGTVRSEETSPALTRLVQQLHASDNVTAIELQPLDASETAQLAGQTAGKECDLADAMRLYQQTEGNPFFVIEMVRTGFLDRPRQDSPHPAAPFPSPAIPPRVQALVSQQLAQVSQAARRAAEIGAVYGQPFPLSLLVKAGQADEDSLVQALDELWQKRVIHEQVANTYEFTHELLREVMVSEISAPQRRLLHRRVAEALEELHAASLEPVSGLIAAHFDRAGMPEKAIPYYQGAGAAAASVYANEEAILLLKRGLDLTGQLPGGAQRDSLEMELLFAVIPPIRLTKGWTAPELNQALNRALALCDQVGTPAQRAQILFGLQSLYVVESKLEKVQTTYDEMRELFLQTQGRVPRFAGLMATGARMHSGRLVEARDSFEEIIANFDEEQVRDLQASQGVNYLALGHVWHAQALWLVGRPDSALQSARQGVEIAARYAQPFNQALTATYVAMLHELRADSAALHHQAEEALRLSAESHAPYYHLWAQILVCFANASERPDAAGLARLEEAIRAFTETGARLRLPYYLSLLARVYAQAGEVDRALKVIEDAIATAAACQERCWDAELHRLRGEFLLARDMKATGLAPSPDIAVAAETEFKRALEIARAQQGLSFEMRAGISLARLWRARQRSPEGKQLLAPILARFSEGQSSPDVQAARALLV